MQQSAQGDAASLYSAQSLQSIPNINEQQRQQQQQQQQLLKQQEAQAKLPPKPTPKPTRAEGILSARSTIPPSKPITNTSSSSQPQPQTQTEPQPPLVGMKLSTLIKSLDPSGLYALEPDAEEQLLALANDFANSLIQKSMRVAQHRNASVRGGGGAIASANANANSAGGAGAKRKRVEVEDVAIVLKKCYGITIPGLSGKGKSRASVGTASGKVALSTARVLGAVSGGNDSSNMGDVGQAEGGVDSSAGNSRGVI
jgi:hypothetical protein